MQGLGDSGSGFRGFRGVVFHAESYSDEPEAP